MLLNPSVRRLQELHDTSYAAACKLSLEFNVHKSHCMVIGSSVSCTIEPMCLGTQPLHWYQSLNYLGVHLVTSKNYVSVYLLHNVVFWCMQCNIF